MVLKAILFLSEIAAFLSEIDIGETYHLFDSDFISQTFILLKLAND